VGDSVPSHFGGLRRSCFGLWDCGVQNTGFDKPASLLLRPVGFDKPVGLLLRPPRPLSFLSGAPFQILLETPYYRTYPTPVQAEVTAALARPDDFLEGPKPLLRDDPDHLARLRRPRRPLPLGALAWGRAPLRADARRHARRDLDRLRLEKKMGAWGSVSPTSCPTASALHLQAHFNLWAV
jgi:hypothetical protein